MHLMLEISLQIAAPEHCNRKLQNIGGNEYGVYGMSHAVVKYRVAENQERLKITLGDQSTLRNLI